VVRHHQIQSLDVLLLAVFNNMGTLSLSEMARFLDAAQCFKATNSLAGRLLELLPSVLNAKELYNLSMSPFLVPI
jgi:hypothetical protein